MPTLTSYTQSRREGNNIAGSCDSPGCEGCAKIRLGFTDAILPALHLCDSCAEETFIRYQQYGMLNRTIEQERRTTRAYLVL